MRQVVRLLTLLLLMQAGTNMSFAQNSFKEMLERSRALVGQPAPEMDFENLLQVPDELNDFSISDFKGQVVILEFWATWCAPCIKQLPHLNALVDHYEQRDVKIISVTPESPDVVTRFLKRKKIHGWVAMDTDESVIKDLGIIAYPTTVVINPEGLIHKYTSPKSISIEYIESLLHPKSVVHDSKKNGNTQRSIAKLPTSKSPSTSSVLNSPVFFVHINKTNPEAMGYGSSSKIMGMIKVDGWSLRKTISEAFNISEVAVIGDTTLLNQKLKLDIQLPDKKVSIFEAMLQSSLEKKFKLTFSKEVRKMAVYALRQQDEIAHGLYNPSESRRFSTDDGIIGASNWPLQAILPSLEESLGMKVFDETGLDGKYDYNLYWDHQKPLSIINALGEQLGLTLEKQTREVEIVQVSRQSDPPKK